MINALNSGVGVVTAAATGYNSNTATTTTPPPTDTGNEVVQPEATLEIGSETTKPATYENPKFSIDKEKLDAINASYKKNVGAFEAMVGALVTNQGKKSMFEGIDLSSEKGILKFKDMVKSGEIVIDAETQKAAQEAISEDGYWGVNAVSDRIIEFAKALTPQNQEAFDKIKDSITKGFESAMKLWGDDVPEITKKTYDTIVEKLDAWEKTLFGKSEEAMAV